MGHSFCIVWPAACDEGLHCRQLLDFAMRCAIRGMPNGW